MTTPNKSPGKKKRRKSVVPDDVRQLRERSSRINKDAKATVTTTLALPAALYKALVELQEQFHAPFSQIAIDCMADGARRYVQVSSHRHRDALTTTTPLRAFPELVDKFDRRNAHLPKHSPYAAPNVQQSQGRIDRYQAEEIDPYDIGLQGLQDSLEAERVVDALRAPLPQAPRLLIKDDVETTSPLPDTDSQ